MQPNQSKTETEAGRTNALVGTGDLLADFETLLTRACNASFDCGEYKLTRANAEEYDAMAARVGAARAKLIDMYRSALSANVKDQPRGENKDNL